MKKTLTGHLSLLLVFIVQIALSQEKTLSGTVTDETDLPLIGASITKKNSKIGTTTNLDGQYSINALEGEILVFNHIGYITKEVLIDTSNQLNVILKDRLNTLNEVVITAQNIKREKKALGYAITILDSAAIENRPEADIGRILNGKAAGVTVMGTGGLAGSGTNINIRNNLSITGNNQPLFVVNGIPFNTSTNAESSITTGNGSYAASSRFLDLDPNSIENISILKGLSATVLYGDLGRNGVILITTKTGSTEVGKSKGLKVSINHSLFFNQISSLPDYQNTYGQGADNSINVDFIGNWGGRFDSNSTVRHHYDQPKFAFSFPEFQGVEVPYKAYQNNVKDFFRTGLGTTTSVNASESTDKISYNINFGRTDEEGYIPGNNFKRLNFGFGGSAKLNEKLSINSTFNFTNSNFETPPIAAFNSENNFSVLHRTLFIPRNLDLKGLPYQDPITGESVYYIPDQENPLWLIKNSKESIGVNRFYNSVNTTYNLHKNLDLIYRVGLDTYTEKQEFYVNKGGVSSIISENGFYKSTSGTNTIWSHNFTLALKDINLSKNINMNGVTGLSLNSETYKRFGVASTDQIIFGLIDHNNFTKQSNRDPLGSSLDFKSTENLVGLFSQLEFDYQNYLFLTLAGRNDWSSTVEKENRTLFYPSASAAFIPTSAFPKIKSEFLNYFKFRLGYGTSAGFPSPYRTRQTHAIATAAFTDRNSNVTNTITDNSILANPNLKAELHKEFELGIETTLLKNKINLETSVYSRNSKNQILGKFIPPSTGYDQTFINAGEIQTKGIEIDLGYTPFDLDNGFKWNSNFIFTAYETTVKELPDDAEIFISGFSDLGNYAIEGEPLGVIKGNYMLRDEQGNILINPSTGDIINSEAVGLENKIIGDPNPDWTFISRNTFRYKNLSLNTQLEYVHGGDFSSTTINNLLRRGVTTDTEDREGTYVIPGVYADPNTGQVLLDSNGNKIPNTIQQGANEIYHLNILDPSSNTIYDGSVIRLREISLSYSLPKKYLNKTPLSSLTFTALGYNLFFYAPNVPKGTNFDPEVISTGVGNGRGLDFQTAPTSKKYSFSINATF